MSPRLIWRLFKVFKRIQSASCTHYYRYDGVVKTKILRRKCHVIECADCGHMQRFEEESQALRMEEKSQRMHGANYRRLRNGLYEGSVNVAKLDI